MNLKAHAREIVLGGFLVALLLFFFGPSLLTPEETAPSGDGVEPAVVSINALLDGPDVDLAMLTAQPGKYQGGGRSLFDYGKIKPPPPSAEELARRAAEAEAARLAAEEARKAAEAERERLRLEALKRQEDVAKRRKNPSPPAEPPAPKPPKFPYKFIGVVGRTESKIAVFVDDKDFLMAKEGETLKEDFRIVKIGYDTLQIGYTDPQFEEDSSILQMGKDKK